MKFPEIGVYKNRILILILLIMIAGPAYAEYGVISESDVDPEVIRINEEDYLGKPVDLDYVFIDGKGEEFTLRELSGKPLILQRIILPTINNRGQ